ncbi:MAG: 3-deoxy-manno-octulosonate cytidylyltransferase [Alphaproteobacteria bacterium]
MNPIILIPARMASTRLPDKPLADIGGKPMIVHVWERAVRSGIGEVVVACDNTLIQNAIEKAGGKAVLTNPDLPSGSDRIWAALKELNSNYDVVVNVQGDMPTIDPSTIKQAVSLLENDTVDIATLASVIRDEKEIHDPAVVKVAIAASGKALYFSRAPIPHGEGEYFHHIGIYAYQRSALEKFVSLPPSPLEKREKLEQLRALEAGMRIDVAVIDTVPLGVDTPETLKKARKWYEQYNT